MEGAVSLGNRHYVAMNSRPRYFWVVNYRADTRDDGASWDVAKVLDERPGAWAMRTFKWASFPEPVSDWTALRFSLRGRFAHLLAGDFRLCSRAMKEVVERSVEPLDDVQWLPVIVTSPANEEREYWALHFPRHTRWLVDLRHSPPRQMRPVVLGERLAGHSVLAPPWPSSMTFLASEATVEALRDIGLPSGHFARAEVSWSGVIDQPSCER